MSEAGASDLSPAEFAPAKINLTLAVGPLQSGGYHPLDSLVAFADWGDEIRVRPAPALALTMGGPFARELEIAKGNLVFQAARAMQIAADEQLGAMIHLDKRIPVAAGVGGGSADAAATLRALNRLWGLDWTLETLCEIGLTIGADVPACLYSRTLRMQGRGEVITPLGGPPAWPALLVNPGVPVPTGAVFRRFDSEPQEELHRRAAPADLVDWIRKGENHLELPARALAPEITSVLDALSDAPGCWLERMSGSGATCFGLFDTITQAESAGEALAAAKPDWFVRPVMLGNEN